MSSGYKPYPPERWNKTSQSPRQIKMSDIPRKNRAAAKQGMEAKSSDKCPYPVTDEDNFTWWHMAHDGNVRE